MPKDKYTTRIQIEEMRQELKNEKLKRSPARHGSIRAKLGGKKGFLKLLGGALFGIVLGMLILALVSIGLARSRGEVPHILGNYIFVVESGSMEPTLKVGAVIYARKPEDASKLKVNDIVTFKTTTGAIVTHRIIKVISDEDGGVRYLTKGDNPQNAMDKEELTPERVIGVFVTVLWEA